MDNLHKDFPNNLEIWADLITKQCIPFETIFRHRELSKPLDWYSVQLIGPYGGFQK